MTVTMSSLEVYITESAVASRSRDYRQSFCWTVISGSKIREDIESFGSYINSQQSWPALLGQ